MNKEINILTSLLEAEEGISDDNKDALLLALKNISKKARINDFLANKYKNDYETTVGFLNASIADIETKNEELLEVNLELERFAYVVSHDIKSPVRSISSFVDLLRQKLSGNLDDRIQEYLDFIQKASKQVNGLIEETLEFSKLNNKEFQREEIDLNQTLFFIKDIIKNIDKDFLVEINSIDLPVVYGNKVMMHKLFQNIIQNGIKYNTSGLRTIAIDYQSTQTHFLFSIKDNGIGMPEESRERIFDMYTRLQSSGDYEGTGIGLAICKKIVEMHGGTIEVDSVQGEGSVFRFTIAKV